MKTRELLKILADSDVRLWVDGEALKWDAPEGIVKGEILEEMRKSKVAILAFLMARETEGNLKGKSVEVSLPSPKIFKRGGGDYPRVFRPCRISEFFGQEEIKRIIAYGLETDTLSHALLFQGISGTGKTTMGRIVAMGLNCKKGPTSEPCCECEPCKSVLNGRSFAYQEFDAALLSGVEDVRRIRQEFDCAPLSGGKSKIILFDESYRLSDQAQATLLKPLEDAADHLYFIFCTTEKMLWTLQNRCQQFKFKKLADHELRTLLTDVCNQERLEVEPDLLREIIKEAEGMPRNALLLLEQGVSSGKVKRIGEGLVQLQRCG